MSKDLTAKTFLALRNKFFDENLQSISFFLRPKKNTQDDPLDEYIANHLATVLDEKCERSGALTSPDIVVFDPEANTLHPIQLENKLSHIFGMEVKKVGRTNQNNISRASAIDFNSTPPCGTVSIYNQAGTALNVRSFYLFVCLESSEPFLKSNKKKITALTLVDGDILNSDFDFYLNITGQREKKIGLGSYGDGMDRARPMLVFPNPLGINGFDKNATLIHSNPNLSLIYPNLIRVFKIKRKSNEFYCYRIQNDSVGIIEKDLGDPFVIPKGRSIATNQRGKFKVSF